ncbi:adenylate kinase [Streptococcus gallolyticus]|nr:adenylate kinase [Streptococcus gallolyticus]MBY5041134.1 adenylate kinase [Streptococcus gallolyticus]
MKRVIVIGCPGSGKSTFSRKLAAVTKLPLFHLDMLNWNANKTTVSSDLFFERQESVLKQEEWIIDGNYGSTLEMRFAACDTIIFLDYPVVVCLAGIRDRVGQARPDMPWIEEELDQDLLAFVRDFPKNSRPQIMTLLSSHADKDMYQFTNREEAIQFLEQIKKPN